MKEQHREWLRFLVLFALVIGLMCVVILSGRP
jgi:hypothetical protein